MGSCNCHTTCPLADRRVEAERAFLHKFHDERRGEHLRDGPRLELHLRGHGATTDLSGAGRSCDQHLIAMGHRNYTAGVHAARKLRLQHPGNLGLGDARERRPSRVSRSLPIQSWRIGVRARPASISRS